MPKRIAIPVTGHTMEEARESIEEINDYVSSVGHDVKYLVELRTDFMGTRPDLRELRGVSASPVIVTNRAGDEGGYEEAWYDSEEERLLLAKQAVQLGLDYVDFEFRHYGSELGLRGGSMRGGNTQLILSYHDFEQTPEDLDDLYQRIRNQGADIVKIATRANNFQDSLEMLNLINGAREKREDMIGICMGPKGKDTRIMGPLMGGYLTFAPLSGAEASAPGQLTADELLREWRERGVF